MPLPQLGRNWQRWIRPRSPAGLTREGALLLSLVTLDVALINRAGYITDLAVAAMGATLALLLIARLLPSGPPPTWLWCATTAALGLSVLLANVTGWPHGWPVVVFVVSSLAGAGLALRGHRAWALGTAAAGFFTFLSVTWRWDPSEIDVLYGLRSAGHALLHGANPYLPVHPSTTLGAPALLHFTYGPVVAAFAALGVLLGDPRVISAVCVAALALALFQLASDKDEGWWLMLTVVVSPLVVAMVISAFPLLVAVTGVAWWLVLRRSHRRLATGLLGLVVGCSLVEVGPLMLLLFLRSRRMLAEIVYALAIGLAIVGGFALWTGVGRYWYYTFGIHFHGAVGVGSLSLAGILTLVGDNPLPGFLGLAVGALALAFVLSQPTPGLGGALTGAAIVTLLAMFFAKFAFINYYFVAFTVAWLAIAARGIALDGDIARWRVPVSVSVREQQADAAAVPAGRIP